MSHAENNMQIRSWTSCSIQLGDKDSSTDVSDGAKQSFYMQVTIVCLPNPNPVCVC
jgi:hypothetical protein